MWWPVDGKRMNGNQPWKGLLKGVKNDLTVYDMYWSVDGGTPVLMGDSHVDWPHKEAWADVTNWRWNGDGPYLIKFVAKMRATGQVVAEKQAKISIWR